MLSSEDKNVANECQSKKLSLQPQGTTSYNVKHRDSLRSIAVTYNTTTSALMKLNRLSSTYIFPGQTIFVPQNKDNEMMKLPTEISTRKALSEEEYSFLAPLSPTLATAAQPSSKPFHDLNTVSTSRQRRKSEEEIINKFPSSVNYNGNLEGGSMVADLLTSRLSFDEDIDEPNTSKRGTSAKLERLSSHDSINSETFEENFIKLTVHFISPSEGLVRGVCLVTPTSVMFDPDPNDPLAIKNGCESYGIMCNIPDIASATMFDIIRHLRKSSASSEPSVSKTATSGCAPSAEEHGQENLNSAVFPTDAEVADLSSRHRGVTLETSKNEDNEVVQHLNFKLHHQFPLLRTIATTLRVSMKGDDDNAEEYVNQQPTPTYANKKDFLYLCIRSQTPMMKTFSVLSALTKSSKKEDITKPEMKKEVKETWFQVPRDRSESFLSFFTQWSPDNYAMDFVEQNGYFMAESLCEVEMPKRNEKLEQISENRSRSCTSSSMDFTDDYSIDDDSFEKEWEIVSAEEAKRRVSMSPIEMANDDSTLIPELLNPCPLLNNDTLLAVCRHLPPRSIGYPWRLLYSTDEHGMSLRTLYRKMGRLEMDSPVIVLIQDGDKNIFGVFCSARPRVSDHFYGNGESFLFKVEPEVEFFDWTGENNFFMKGDPDSIAFGGGDGSAGLWIDGSILHGRSHPCLTFNNPVLSNQEDFYIQTLEVWAIGG